MSGVRYVTGMREITGIHEIPSYKSNNFFFKSQIGLVFIYVLEFTLMNVYTKVVRDIVENVLERFF